MESTEVLDEISTETSTEKSEDKTKEYIDRANNMAEEGNYIEAFASLDTAEELYGPGAGIDTARYDIQMRQLLESINAFMESEDYGEAIKSVSRSSASLKGDKEIIEKFNVCVLRYKEQILSKAESAFKEEGYDKAIELLNEGLQILPDDSDFLDEKTNYEEYEPVSLSKLKQTTGTWEFGEKTDPRGNVVSNAVVFYGEYYIGGKYSHFSCTIDPYENFTTNYKFGVVKAEIYADDKLVYTSGEITYKTDDLSVAVDIGNAQYIRFEYTNISEYREANYSSDIFMYNAYVSK